MSKNQKLILYSFSVICIISIITCVIVNLAIDQTITWSAYPILSVPFGWLILSPMIIKKYGIILSICSLDLFILPFLLILDKITPGSSWFIPLGIPSAIAGVIMIWVAYVLFRFVKTNLYYKSAIIVFLVGAIVNPVISYYTDKFLNEDSGLLSIILQTAAFIIVSVALFVLGYKRKKDAEAKSAII